MLNGQKVFDADTHVHPSVESLEPYFDPEFRARLPELEPYNVGARSDQTTTPREDPSRQGSVIASTRPLPAPLLNDSGEP